MNYQQEKIIKNLNDLKKIGGQKYATDLINYNEGFYRQKKILENGNQKNI